MERAADDHLALALGSATYVPARAWLADIDATVMVLQALNLQGRAAAEAAPAVAKKVAHLFGSCSFMAARAAHVAAAAASGERHDCETWLEIWGLFDDCRDFVTMSGQFS